MSCKQRDMVSVGAVKKETETERRGRQDGEETEWRGSGGIAGRIQKEGSIPRAEMHVRHILSRMSLVEEEMRPLQTDRGQTVLVSCGGWVTASGECECVSVRRRMGEKVNLTRGQGKKKRRCLMIQLAFMMTVKGQQG